VDGYTFGGKVAAPYMWKWACYKEPCDHPMYVGWGGNSKLHGIFHNILEQYWNSFCLSKNQGQWIGEVHISWSFPHTQIEIKSFPSIVGRYLLVFANVTFFRIGSVFLIQECYVQGLSSLYHHNEQRLIWECQSSLDFQVHYCNAI
jgi:hypothetical protein